MLGPYQYKDRGPVSSKEYNERMRDTAQELVNLLGRVTAAEAEMDAMAMLYAVEQATYSNIMENILAELDAANNTILENSEAFKKTCTLFDESNVLITDYQGNQLANKLTWEPDTGIVVLPYTEHVSKIGFLAPNDAWVIDPGVNVNWTFSKEDNNANDPLRAIDNNKTTAFMVHTDDLTAGNSDLTFYIKIPAETAEGALVNYIELDPCPRAYLDLVELSYATAPGAALDNNDPTQWKNLWVNGDTITLSSKRFRAPQKEDIDSAQTSTGIRRYYFGERRITAVKVVLRAPDERINAGAGDEYFVGIRSLDVGHVTFASTGTRVFEFSLPAGTKGLTAIEPRLVNSSSSSDGIDGVGSTLPETIVYRYSWGSWVSYTVGTSVDSLTLVRVKTTMSAASNGCTPVLVGFDLLYNR